MKYFGIGLQRTGTASLCKAFELLGFKSCHGDYGRFPGSLSMKDAIYNQYDMFADTPYSILYDKLDLYFPNSKFIYTSRNVDQWTRSVEKLFAINNQFLSMPNIAMHHVLIYGQPVFNAEIAKSVFLKHQSDVREYFRDKKNFIEIDLDNSFGWGPLCEFTGRNIPDAGFPWINQL